MDILPVISFPMRVEGATSPNVRVRRAGRTSVIFVRAALFSVEEAARISSESVPNDGGVIKEHDGSVSEGLASYQGHFPVDDRAFEHLSSGKVRGEKTPPWRQEHKRRHVKSSARADGQDRTGRSTRLKRRSTAGHGCRRKSGTSSVSNDASLSCDRTCSVS